MSGLQLSSMDCSDMLDVLHYMFEEDMFVGSPAEVESKSKTRETIYRLFYNKKYEYAVTTGKSNDYSLEGADGSFYPNEYPENDEIIVPLDPTQPRTSKSYIPPTDFNPDAVKPFGTFIDQPLG